MPFGAQVRTNRGLLNIQDVIGLKLIDTRVIYLGATEDNRGSFTVPLGELTSFSQDNFQILCNAGRATDIPPSVRRLSVLNCWVIHPATILNNSVATVHFRGGNQGNFTFRTWIIQT